MARGNGPFRGSNFESFDDWYSREFLSPSIPDVDTFTEKTSSVSSLPFTDHTQSVVGLAGLSLSVTFGSPTITVGAVSITGLGGLALSVTFGSPTVTVGAVDVTGLGALSVPVTFGTPVVSATNAVVDLGGLSVPITIGGIDTVAIVTASQNVVGLGGLGLAIAFGDLTVTVGAASVVALGGLSVPVTFGAFSVSENVTIDGLGGLSVPVTFGTPTVTAGAVAIVGLGGIDLSVTFGTPKITREALIVLDATRKVEPWSVLIRVSGIGETHSSSDDGRWVFTNDTPAFGIGDSTFKEWLTDFPSLMSEVIDLKKGGIAASGNVSASLIDGSDNDNDRDALTALLRTGSPPIARLEVDLAPTTLFMTLAGDPGIDVEDVVFVGAEAVRITDRLTSTIYGIHRGVLGTDAVPHGQGEYVKAFNTTLPGRRIEVSIVKTDSTDPMDEFPLGTFSLDDFTNAPDGSLQFQGASILRYLARQVASQQPHWLLHQITDAGSLIITHVYQPNGNALAADRFFNLWPDARNFVLVGKDDDAEVIRIDTSSGALRIDARGQLATTPKDPEFLAVIKPVLTADPNFGAFRYSPSRATSRSADDWVVTSHWVDILLCLLVSAPRNNDGLELTNFVDGRANYSCLPPGWGIGLPASLIDWNSFMSVKARTASWVFPSFTLADPMSFADLANKFFLEVLGAYMTFEGGKLKLILPRIPMLEEDIATFDADVYLDGTPRMKLALNEQVSSVTYTYKSPANDDVTLTFTNGDFTTFVNASGLYGQTNDQKVEVPALRSSDNGLSPFLRQLAQRKLFRLAQTNWAIDLDTDLAQFAIGPGDYVSFSHPELIDTSLGVRGATYPAEVVSRQFSVNDKLTGIHYSLRSFGPALRVARVTPNAIISSVVTSSPVVLAVSVNEFTCPDAPSGQPSSDVAAFSVGDVVRLVDLRGRSFADAVETITAIDLVANTISLSGDFGLGALSTAIGAVVDFVAFDSASEDQQSKYAFGADAATMTVGAGDMGPFVYGEP